MRHDAHHDQAIQPVILAHPRLNTQMREELDIVLRDRRWEPIPSLGFCRTRRSGAGTVESMSTDV